MKTFKVLVDLEKRSVRNRCDVDTHEHFTKTDFGYAYDNGVHQHNYQVAFAGDQKHATKVKSALLITLKGISNLRE